MGFSDRVTGWRPSAVGALAMVTTVVGGQFVILAVRPATGPVTFVSLVLLELLGAFWSFQAAQRRPYRVPWRLIGVARVCGVASLLCFLAGGRLLWPGLLLHVAAPVLLASAAFLGQRPQFQGRPGRSFVAEILIVVAACAMPVWLFVLGPALGWATTTGQLIRLLMFLGSDLMLLTAVVALLLAGAMPSLRHPAAPMVTGMFLLTATDICWNAWDYRGGPPDIWMLNLCTVLASLLLTIAPLAAMGLIRPPVTMNRKAARSQRLVLPALGVGAAMMIAATIREHELYPWVGLVVCLLLMVGAIVVHMSVSLRTARDLIVTDPLTGLANRTGLDDAIQTALHRPQPAALLLIDLADFKLINDAYGHASGDAVLVEFAHRLRTAVRAGDTCARIGGDEFAVLVLAAEAAEGVAHRILGAAAAEPVRLGDDGVITLKAGIGLAEFVDNDSPKELMRRADLAMYAAKRTGTHAWMRHDPSMVDRRALDAALSDELAEATRNGELVVYYQPIVDIESGRPAGFEALVRWQHPERGLVSPLEFIPVAERTGLIVDIGLFVLEKALTAVRDVPGDPYVSVNVAPRQLQSPTLVHDVLAVVRRTGIAPARVVLEVTESALVDEQAGIAILDEFRANGLRIAVDDFGTGYSSLHYLSRLPVDILKIDRSFVAELNGTATGAAITEAIVRLAQALRLRTIAEGIETAAQARELVELGCRTGQGFLYAPPRPAEQALTRSEEARS